MKHLKEWSIIVWPLFTSCLWWSGCCSSAAAEAGPTWLQTSPPKSPGSPQIGPSPERGML